jgi:Mg2+ and Co2+ transporter CorA
MSSLLLTNILLIIIVLFLFAIYRDLNNRVVKLIAQLNNRLEQIKHFILMNEKERNETAKILHSQKKKN